MVEACRQFVSMLHGIFPVIVRYWLQGPLKQCELHHFDELVKIVLTYPIRISIDGHHVFLFATHWAKVPFTLLPSRGRAAIYQLLTKTPLPFKMKLDSFYRPQYDNFRYDAYVDARFRRDALLLAFAREILSMFSLRDERRLCRAIVVNEFGRIINNTLNTTHPLHRQSTKKIILFSGENKI